MNKVTGRHGQISFALIQLTIFYFFFGHLISAGDLKIFSPYWAIVSLGVLGLVFQLASILEPTLLKRVSVAILLYTLFYINPFVSSVGFPIFVFFLFLTAIEMSGLFSPTQKKIALEAFIYFLAAHYFFSGYFKMMTWLNPNPVSEILKSPVARGWAVSLAENLNSFGLDSMIKKFVIFFEMTAVLLVVPRLRKYVLMGLLGFHIILVFLLNVLQLTMPYFAIYIWLISREYEKTV